MNRPVAAHGQRRPQRLLGLLRADADGDGLLAETCVVMNRLKIRKETTHDLV